MHKQTSSSSRQLPLSSNEKDSLGLEGDLYIEQQKKNEKKQIFIRLMVLRHKQSIAVIILPTASSKIILNHFHPV